jgi:hypothetical protein
MTPIVPIQNTNNIRLVDFIRLTTASGTYLFCTAPKAITVSAVDSDPFSAVGFLLQINPVQRDIKSTANETTFTVVGVDTSNLAFVLGQNLKGSKVEMWHGFFNTNGELITTGGTGGLYQFFNGYVNSFSIGEQWMEDFRMFAGVISISAASIQLVLQNRIGGRYTNNNSWQFFTPNDTSMNRVAFISNINYRFGKDAPANS